MNKRRAVIRLSELEDRIAQLERIVSALARFADPTSVRLPREDRDVIVAHATATRRPHQPEPELLLPPRDAPPEPD